VLLGLEAPAFDPVVPLEGAVEADLNENQRDLVRRAAAARDYCLIQGPPGTGKTSTILPRITAHARSRNERVVIAAFTNRAVDEIHERLDRAGLAHVDLRRRGADRTGPDRAAALGEAGVFLSTIAGLLKRRAALLTLIGRIDALIIDEASQALEPELVGLCALAGRSVLIGDHLQLPPVVAQPEGTCRPASAALRAAGFTDLRLTLFERLWQRCQAAGWTAATGMLETHFRMHAEVAALVNPTYGGRLRAGTAAQSAPLSGYDPGSADPVERTLARHRTIFWPTAPSPHRDHPAEAGLVAAIAAAVERARGAAFGPGTLGVVTPWRVQVNAIQRALPPDLRDLVTVDTVERFQGMERDVIVISLAVSHPGQLARLQSLSPDGRVDRKLNVALSRARGQVVILGCEAVLRLAGPYADLIDGIRAAGGAVSGPLTG
jgi:superfamily I DNA and/or RNA helicase